MTVGEKAATIEKELKWMRRVAGVSGFALMVGGALKVAGAYVKQEQTFWLEPTKALINGVKVGIYSIGFSGNGSFYGAEFIGNSTWVKAGQSTIIDGVKVLVQNATSWNVGSTTPGVSASLGGINALVSYVSMNDLYTGAFMLGVGAVLITASYGKRIVSSLANALRSENTDISTVA